MTHPIAHDATSFMFMPDVVPSPLSRSASSAEDLSTDRFEEIPSSPSGPSRPSLLPPSPTVADDSTHGGTLPTVGGAGPGGKKRKSRRKPRTPKPTEASSPPLSAGPTNAVKEVRGTSVYIAFDLGDRRVLCAFPDSVMFWAQAQSAETLAAHITRLVTTLEDEGGGLPLEMALDRVTFHVGGVPQTFDASDDNYMIIRNALPPDMWNAWLAREAKRQDLLRIAVEPRSDA